MPRCKNDETRRYTGNEPSPKGRGYCAHAEEVGKRRKGKDGNFWVARETTKGKRWFKANKSVKSPRGYGDYYRGEKIGGSTYSPVNKDYSPTARIGGPAYSPTKRRISSLKATGSDDPKKPSKTTTFSGPFMPEVREYESLEPGRRYRKPSGRSQTIPVEKKLQRYIDTIITVDESYQKVIKEVAQKVINDCSLSGSGHMQRLMKFKPLRFEKCREAEIMKKAEKYLRVYWKSKIKQDINRQLKEAFDNKQFYQKSILTAETLTQQTMLKKIVDIVNQNIQ